MRYLAIARFRLLTTIRAANFLFAVAAIAAIGPAALISFMPDEVFRAGADDFLGVAATTAVIAWIAHALILAIACEAFGNVKFLRPQITSVQTDAPGDLMDTAPIRPGARFWGEAAGILAAAMTIHICTLPVLVLVAALSPLPTAMFVTAEAATIALVVLASAGGAWKRRAPRTRWSGTRGVRSSALCAIVVLIAVRYATRWEVFRDSLILFLNSQASPRVWSAVSNAVENPLLLFMLLSLLYTAYIAFYYWSSVRTARR
jgi:hypothetical protein